MLPLTEMLGPSGPLVATRQGEPSSHADRIKSRIFWLNGMRSGPCLRVGGRTIGAADLPFQAAASDKNWKRPAAATASPAIRDETPLRGALLAALQLEVAVVRDRRARLIRTGEHRAGEDREGRDGGEDELGHGSCS